MSAELAATLSALTTREPEAFLRAGLIRGWQLGLPDEHILASIRRTGSRPVSALLADRDRTERIILSARSHHNRSPEERGERAKIRAARQVVARVLAPTRRSHTERAILAYLGLALIESGWPTVKVGRATIAAELGIGEPTVRDAIRRMEREGVIRVTSRRRGSSSVYKIEPLRTTTERAALADQFDAVGALARGVDHPVADAIRGVADPRWGYGETVDHRHWLLAVRSSAGVDDPRGRRTRERLWTELLAPTDDSAAAERKAAALDARQEQREARLAELNEVRAQWPLAQAWARAAVRSVPGARSARSPEARMKWVRSAHPMASPADLRNSFKAKALAAELRRLGWTTKAARSAADTLLGRKVAA